MAKTHLRSAYVVRNAENAFSERNSRYQRRKGENVVGKGKNAFCRVKTYLAMAKTHLRSAYVVRNAENAFTEGKPV